MARIGTDATDQTQRNLQNVKFGNYMVSHYFSDKVSDAQIHFATEQPNMMLNADNGVASSVIDAYSNLILGNEDRPLDKLQLMQRPFITVPYLGKGSCDPTLESQLQQGEIVSEKKSVGTLSETSYSNLSDYPMQGDIKQRVNNASFMIEESAMNGWVRGGSSTRDMTTRPTDSSY